MIVGHMVSVPVITENTVTTRKWAALLLTATLSIAAGCGGGSTANVQNPPPPPAGKAVSIAFQPAPPSTLMLNTTASLTAVVNNDPTNSGVDWSLNCQTAGNCGSVSPPHTNSGQAATYTPPAALSGNSQSINVIAFATADHTKNVTAPLAISGFGSALKGTYIVETTGNDSGGFPYQRVGAIVLDGNGNITGGEQTVNFLDPASGNLMSVSDTVIGGSYFLGADGRGVLTVNTADQNVGVAGNCASAGGSVACGIQTFSLVALSTSQAFVAYQGGNEISTGTMDLQTAVAAPTSGYSFVASGIDVNAFTNVALGGVLNIDSPGSISGNGSEMDFAYNDGSGLVTDPYSSVSGTVSALDSFGATAINLQVSNGNTGFGATIQFTAYIVDATHMKLIETDTDPNSGTGAVYGVSAGIAIGQGAATGTFTTNKAFSGRYAFGVFGEDISQSPSTLSAAGVFTAGAGALNGYLDEFQYEGASDLYIGDHFTGNYSIDAAGTGRVDTLSPVTGTGSLTFNNPSNGTGPELVFYVNGTGNPALILDADAEPNFASGGAGTGVAYPVISSSSFAGDYAVSLAQNFNSSQADSSGQICANGSSVVCPGGSPNTLSGTLDTNSGFNPVFASPLTDGFQKTGIAGRLTGTLANPNFFSSVSNSTGGQISAAYYVIDSGHGFVIETDGGGSDTISPGVNPGNLTFGYFATRTPVCQGCP